LAQFTEVIKINYNNYLLFVELNKKTIKMKKTFNYYCKIITVFLLLFTFEISVYTQEKSQIKTTVLYDNYLFTEGTRTDWGFSCLIEGTEKTIMFDTGTKSKILFHNIDELKVDLAKVEQIVISHNHGDHTGGLFSILQDIHEISVYLPVSFPDRFIKKVEDANSQAIRVDEPVEICKNVYLTGEMGIQIREQSLILDTKKGLVIITGCSHQGIVNIVKKAKEIVKKDVYLVFGGFHLLRHSENEVNNIIKQFRVLGVQKVGATHCTGDKAIQLIKDAYGEDYVIMGTGKTLFFTSTDTE